MDHPTARVLARYALGEVTDDTELTELEDHLLICESCRHRAMAVDLIGSDAEAGNDLLLHIAAPQQDPPVALCGDNSSRNIISEMLLSGMSGGVVCSKCLSVLKSGAGDKPQYVN